MQTMIPVRSPVDGEAMAREIDDRSLFVSYRDLELHLFHAADKPDLAQEIGRIREVEYRAVGAGRGVECDLDERDVTQPGYLQLIAWDPEEREVVSMYRLIDCGQAIRTAGLPLLRTSMLFEFSDSFVDEVLSRSVELGRSVVNSGARRALQGLFSIWHGLGAIFSNWRHIEYFFGNVSIYRSLGAQRAARLAGFLMHWHGDPNRPVRARVAAELPPVAEDTEERPIIGRSEEDGPGRTVQAPDGGESQHENPEQPSVLGRPLAAIAPEKYRTSFERFRDRASNEGWSLPPILLSYLKTAPTLRVFDLASDSDFGDAWELAILVGRNDLTEKTRRRIMTL